MGDAADAPAADATTAAPKGGVGGIFGPEQVYLVAAFSIFWSMRLVWNNFCRSGQPNRDWINK